MSVVRPQPSVLWLTGAVAQLGERVLCKHEVIGSIPFSSTKSEDRGLKTEDRNRLDFCLLPSERSEARRKLTL